MQIIAKYIFGLGAIIAFALLSLAILPARAEYVDTTPDCDKYSVMYCGSFTKSEILKKYNNGDGKNSASNIQSIFDKFSISKTNLENANYVDGVVYQNGEVKVGKKVVATGSKTYIRTMGVVSTSKMGSAQAAKVALDKDGKFRFAVMTPCGNPVTGKPVEPPKPEPKPQSLVCDALTLTVVNEQNRQVQATVSGTPTNTTISGYKIDFGDGTAVNQQTASHTYGSYGKFTVTGHVSGMVDGSSKTVTSAACAKTIEFAKPPEPPKPQALTCDNLMLTIVNKEKREVSATVSGTPTNTTISGYKIDFGDGTAVNQQTASHTYGSYGKFTVTGHVSGMVDGKEVVVSSPNCVRTVEFKETVKPVEQDLVCDLLKIVSIDREKRQVEVMLSGTATNTTISNYKIDFGDGDVVNEQRAEHVYDTYGQFTIVGHVTAEVDGKYQTVTSDNCKQLVKFDKPVTPCPTNPNIPVDDPNCKPCPTNPELNYDDPKCVEEPEELPDTGAGSVIGLFTGVSMLGALGHRMWLSRRF
jgi:hypothetical protein